jgi:murein DD-endopeptidase MepM/ murein hydrolase activator NlpD
MLEPRLPEQRIFLRSERETRFLRLTPVTQLLGYTGSSILAGWMIVASSIVLMDSIGSGKLRDQASRDLVLFESRVNELASERDTRANEAAAAQSRFNVALTQISAMQSELLSSEERVRELQTGLTAVQSTLRRTMKDRDAARDAHTEVLAQIEGTEGSGSGALPAGAGDTVDVLSAALADTSLQRDQMVALAEHAEQNAAKVQNELRLLEEKNDRIFSQLEDAVIVSVEPLDKMFRAAGLSTDSLLKTVRSGLSGQGGPLTPITFSTKGGVIDPDSARANGVIEKMDRLNLYRIAAQKAPFALPLKGNFRYTSGFGPRWGRMHQGTDFAAAYGTPIYATADGVVTSAGWGSGYGRLVKIQHEFGIETRYAHQSKILVKVGQRVSRGQQIGAMGNSGRSTGTHLHYEVRVGGQAVNPMTYIKAAQDVF